MNELFSLIYDEWEDSPEVREALNKAIICFGSLMPDAEDILTHIGYVYEKQGFQNGYRCAMERRCHA